MKKLSPASFLILLCFQLFAATSLAQEKFDIVTFTTPKDWQKEVQPSAVQIGKQNPQTGGVCLITMFKALPGGADSKANFNAAWETVVKAVVKPSGAPQMQPAGSENGWTIESGLAQYEQEGKKGVVMLVTATGGGKMTNVLILTNTGEFEKDFTAFLESIVLPKVETKPAGNAQPTEATAASSRLIGKWQRSGSIAPKSGDPVSTSMAGSIKSRYEFKTDGSYVFTQRVFGMSNTKIIIVKENGTYQIDGDKITITPKKSQIESYSKSGGGNTLGKLLGSENRPLETITYRFTFHYFSGIKEWNLVLQADSPTQRDGQFSNNKSYENAYYFDQKYINEDLTAP